MIVENFENLILFFVSAISKNDVFMVIDTAYHYRNLLSRILLLAKMMIIVNHDCHKYKYEFKKILNGL